MAYMNSESDLIESDLVETGHRHRCSHQDSLIYVANFYWFIILSYASEALKANHGDQVF